MSYPLVGGGRQRSEPGIRRRLQLQGAAKSRESSHRLFEQRHRRSGGAGSTNSSARSSGATSEPSGPRSDNVSGDQMTMAVPDPGWSRSRFAEFAGGVAGARHRGQTSESTAVGRIPVSPCAPRPSMRSVGSTGRFEIGWVRRRRPLPTASGERDLRLLMAHCFFRPSSRPCLVRLECDHDWRATQEQEPGPFRREMEAPDAIRRSHRVDGLPHCQGRGTDARRLPGVGARCRRRNRGLRHWLERPDSRRSHAMQAR